MVPVPHRTVALHVHQVPGGPRHPVEITRHGARRRPHHLAVLQPDNAFDRPEVRTLAPAQRVHHTHERDLAFPGDYGESAVLEIHGRPVGRVGSGHHHRYSPRTCRRDHRQRGLTHPEQAHLAQVIETVLVDHRDPRLVEIQRNGPLLFGTGQHRVEQRHVVARFADACRGIQGAERRVGPVGGPERRVESQEVGLADENVNAHGYDDSAAGAVLRSASGSATACR